MKNRTRGSLIRELCCRYFRHTLIVVPVSIALAWCLQLLIGNGMFTIGIIIILIRTFGFLTLGLADVIDVYEYNYRNSARVAREMYRHRDVFPWNSDQASHWRFAKKLGHHRHVRPYYYQTFLFTAICCSFPLGIPLILLAIVLRFRTFAYIHDHLIDPEIKDLYANTQSYSSMLDHAKKEAHEQEQIAFLKEQLARERARNQGFPPDVDTQDKRPPKPD